MTKRPLASRDRRALAVGGIVAAIVLANAFVIRPYLVHVGALRGSIERETSLLRRELGLLELADSLPTRLAAVARVAGSQAEQTFLASDPTVATTFLAGYVAVLAEESDVRVDRVDARTPAPAEAGNAIRVSIAATGDIHGLMAWLAGIETGEKLVIVERFRAAQAPAESYDQDGNLRPAESPGVEALELEIDVLAFVAAAEESS